MFLSMISISWFLSIIFTFLKHPLSLGFILLLQTILISLLSGILNLNFWFSYILFLVMIGGMLVLFIYMTSIASNEKFKLSNKIIYLSISLMLVIFFLLFTDNFFLYMNMLNYDFSNQTLFNNNMSMNKFFNFPHMMIMMILMIYLLITLIAIVKITYSKMGPLRSMM